MKGTRILVVDDYVSAAQAMARLLRLAGHTVAVAVAADEVVPTARAFRPELILLDVALPGARDGVEIASRLRRETTLGPVKIVAVTGFDAADVQGEIRRAGFDHYLLKPVGLEAIESIIDRGRASSAI